MNDGREPERSLIGSVGRSLGGARVALISVERARGWAVGPKEGVVRAGERFAERVREQSRERHQMDLKGDQKQEVLDLLMRTLGKCSPMAAQ